MIIAQCFMDDTLGRRKEDLLAYCNQHLRRGKSPTLFHCPYHEDDDPSFRVNIATNQFKCFGCDKYGDIFDLCKHIEGKPLRGSFARLLRSEKPQVLSKKAPFPSFSLKPDFSKLSLGSRDYLREKKIAISELEKDVTISDKRHLTVIGRNSSQKQVCAQIIRKGFKHNAPGSTVRGSFHVCGEKENPTYYLCEGWATAKALHKYLKNGVGVFCFGFANLEHVAKIFEAEKKPFFTMPDKDKNSASLPNKIEFPNIPNCGDWSDLDVKHPKKFAGFFSPPDFFSAKPEKIKNPSHGMFLPDPQNFVLRHSTKVDRDGETIEFPSVFRQGQYSACYIVDEDGKGIGIVVKESTTGFHAFIKEKRTKSECTDVAYNVYPDFMGAGLIAAPDKRTFLHAIENLPSHLFPRFECHLKKGWQKVANHDVYWQQEEGNIYYSSTLSNLPCGKKTIANSLPDWACNLIKKSPVFLFLVSHIGFYAYKRFLSGKAGFQGGHVVHILGGSGTGKTTVCTLFNRLLGFSTNKQLDNTFYAACKYITENEELFLDETETVGRSFEDLTQRLVYYVSIGADRGRFNRPATPFTCSLVTTGERAILTSTSKAGSQRRALQISAGTILTPDKCANLLSAAEVCSIKPRILEAIPFLEVKPLNIKVPGLHPDLTRLASEVLSFGVAVSEQAFGLKVPMEIIDAVPSIFYVDEEASDSRLSLEERSLMAALAEIFLSNQGKFPYKSRYSKSSFYSDKLDIENTLGFFDDDTNIVYFKHYTLSRLKERVGRKLFFDRLISLKEKKILIMGPNEDGGTRRLPRFLYPCDYGRIAGISVCKDDLDVFL